MRSAALKIAHVMVLAHQEVSRPAIDVRKLDLVPVSK